MAAHHGCESTFRWLMDHVKPPDTFTFEILHLRDVNHSRILKLLFKYKPKYTQCTDENGNTPMHIAAYDGNLEAVNVLLPMKSMINVKNKDGKVPMHLAAEAGHHE